jgi:4-nitrophenol 2-monooxygenase / 4-nitrocatechol 4-monooxygenase, reductase component
MIDADAFRQTMRQVVSGVFVITTSREDRLHATTATAFLPLSIDPPLVLVCLHRESDTHRALSAGGRIGINVLSQEQEHLSTRFASKTAERSRFDDVPRFSGPHGVTLFNDSAAAIEVDLTDTAAGGDHTIFIGRVLWSRIDAKRAPLVHYQRAYHKLESLVEITEAVQPRKRA